MFHTGYVQNYKLYLTREQLDGANQDKEYRIRSNWKWNSIPESFSTEFIFEYTPKYIVLVDNLMALVILALLMKITLWKLMKLSC